MPAAQVADLVFDAVREERLHILTHKKGSIEAIGHRLRGILANDPPHIKIRAPFRWSGSEGDGSKIGFAVGIALPRGAAWPALRGTQS